MRSPRLKSTARLIASARRQPELAMRVSQALTPDTQRSFVDAVASPPPTPARTSRPGPGLSKCKVSAGRNAMSAQLQWYASQLSRTR